MNDTLKTIGGRYSCRRYTAEKPTREQLQQMAVAAVQAPSAMNRQPWQVHVITDEALRADMEAVAMEALRAMEDQSVYQRFMERGGTVFYNAPAFFVITAAEGNEVDVGIVSQNITLAATALGLGSVICGMMRLCFNGPRGGEFAQRIGFAPGHSFAMAVLAGCPDGEGTPHEPDLEKIHFVE